MNLQTSALTLAILAASPAALSNELPEIVVTAEFRDSTLEQTPVSASVLTSEAIQDRAAQSLEELLGMAPNVNLSSGSSRGRFFQIRGIGERSQFIEPLNPSVGLLIDGVDFSELGLAGTLYDTEQVEVLRGPQGTRYGANGLAGVINIKTRQATATPEARIDLTLADFNTTSTGVVVGGGLTDTLNARLAVQQYKSDGYYENDFLGKRDTNQRDELTARLKLAWQPSETLAINASLLHLDIDNGYDVFNFNNRHHTISDQPGQDTQRTWGGSLSAEQSLGDWAQLLLQGTYAESDSTYSYDVDWAYSNFHPWGYDAFDEYLRDRKNHSIEARLTSQEGGRLLGVSDWVFGLYHKQSDERLVRDYTYDPLFRSDYSTKLSAVFGEIDTPLSDNWLLSIGLRYERWEANYSDSQLSHYSPDENLWGGRIALEYQIDDNSFSYLSLSRGYKAGGINTNASIPLQQRTFDSENQLNLELGYKAKLLDNRLRLGAALFYADRKEQQVKNSFVVVDPDTNATSFEDFIDNAAAGTNYGVELELLYQATDSLQLFSNLGLLEAEFDDYTNAFGTSLNGRDQAHAPNYQWSGGFRYQLGNGWFTRWEIESKDGFYFSDRHAARADRYTLVHTQLGYEQANWTATLWARNLGNRSYETRGFGSFGNNPANGYITEEYTQLGEPRMMGVSISYQF